MDNTAIAQRLKTLSLCGAGLVLAFLVGLNIGNANYMPLIFGGALFAAASFALFSGRLYWVLTIASSFLGGTFPILGGSFTPFQLLMAMGVAKFLVEDTVLRRARLETGNRFDLFMIIGFMGIMTLHGVHDRFGMKFLGSSVWGGRNYINVFVGLAAFFVVQSIPMNTKIWAKLPYCVLAVTGFDLLIAVVTTIFPNSIYTIYPFYSAVSTAGLEELITGGTVETARVGAFGNIGFTLIVLALSWVSLRHLLHPSNLLPLLAFIGGFIGVLASSFRSSVLSSGIAVVVCGIRDLKWGVFLLVPALAVLLFGISILNSEIISLPKQVQRSLAFVPGKWDVEMKRDATASNEFRSRVWRIWTRDYFPLHPLLGRGFGFRSEWAERSVLQYDPYADVQMVEVGNIHNGLFAALDAFGIVGTFFFVIWNIRLLFRTLQIGFRSDDGAEGITLRFLALYVAVSIISFWMGAQNVGSFLPQEFALAGLFLRLRQETKLPSPPMTSSLQEPRQASPETAIIV